MPASAKLLHRYVPLVAARLGVIAPPAPLLRLYAPRVAPSYRGVCATCTAPYLHTHPVVDRGCHIAAFYAVVAVITPRRFALPIRRRGSIVRFDRRAVTMMICPSESYVIRRRVGTYCRSASRLWRAARAADVLRASDALLTYRDARASRRCRSPLI